MHLRKSLLAALVALACMNQPALASINASQLGASYDSTKSNLTFKVYSSRATRIELYLYSSASGAAEKAHYVMTLGTGGVWSTTLSSATLSSLGLTGTIYYGYRAWGPNWPYSAAGPRARRTGFVTRRRRQRQPLQSEQAAARSRTRSR